MSGLRWVEVRGPQLGNASLWQTRLGTGRDAAEHDIAASHGVRSLWLAGSPQPDKVATEAGGKVTFQPPRMLEIFGWLGDPDANPKDYETCTILGARAANRSKRRNLDTKGPQRLLVTPAERRWPDGGIFDRKAFIAVPACRLAAGSIGVTVATNADALGPCLAGLGAIAENGAFEIELDPEGVVFAASLPDPTGAERLRGRVRLVIGDGSAPELRLLPERLSLAERQGWLKAWNRLDTLFGSCRATAWARIDLLRGETVPSIHFRLEKQGDTWVLPVKANEFDLDVRLLVATLADQPTESQRLPPEGPLQLRPEMATIKTMGVDERTLTLRAGTPGPAAAEYRWQSTLAPKEILRLEADVDLTLTPRDLAAALRRRYGAAADPLEPGAPVPAFLPEQRGWLELPIAPNAAVPKPFAVTNAGASSGFATFGLRRRDLNAQGVRPTGMPWSITLEAVQAFEASYSFKQDELTAATIRLASPFFTLRGLLWAAGTAPDARDALPTVEPLGGAHVGIELFRADLADPGSRPPAVLKALTIAAPLRPKAGWDAYADLAERRPVLAESTLRLWPERFGAPGAALPARHWRRHPHLPAIQLVPLTRSADAEGSPLASRQLLPYDLTSTSFDLSGLGRPVVTLDKGATVKPALGTLHGWPGVPLATVTVPGVLLTHEAPDATYRHAYRFDVPLLDEPFARMDLPPQPDDPLSAPPTPPLVTALDRTGLQALAERRRDRRRLADGELALAWNGQPIGQPTPVSIGTLVEPWVWHARAQFDDEVAGDLTIGTLILRDSQGAALWQASGNAAAAGFSGQIAVAPNGDLVVTAAAPPDNLIGWSVADRDRDVGGQRWLFDARGVGAETAPRRLENLLLRDIRIEKSRAGSTYDDRRLTQLTTLRPLALAVASGSWRIEAVNLPCAEVDGRRRFLPPADAFWGPSDAREGRQAALRGGWTWHLAEQQPGGFPLRFFGFAFVPTGLAQWEGPLSGEVDSLVVEGRLHLPETRGAEVVGLGNEVRLQFKTSSGALRLVAVEALDPRGLRWRVPRSQDDRSLWQGTAVLTIGIGLGGGSGDRLELRQPTLRLDMLGRTTTLPLEPASLGWDAHDVALTVRPGPTGGQDLTVRHGKLTLDLRHPDQLPTSPDEPRHVLSLSFGVRLGGSAGLELELDAGADAAAPRATWLGNPLPGGALAIDSARHALTIVWGGDDTTELTLLAYGDQLPTTVRGALGLVLGPAAAGGSLPLSAGYLELVLRPEAAPLRGLVLTYRAAREAAAWDEALRLDGDLEIDSAIGWPRLELPAPTGATVPLNPPTGDAGYGHKTIFRFHDHRLPPASVGASADASKPGLVFIQPVELLVETVSILTATSGDKLSWHGVERLTLVAASRLAERLMAMQVLYTFGPQYRGNDKEYAHAGIARLRRALGGLLVNQIAESLRPRLERAVLLAGQTVAFGLEASIDGSASPHHLLHLPFFALYPADDDFKQALNQRNWLHTTYRIARQDVPIDLPLQLDPASRIVLSAAELTGMASAMRLPFAIAATPRAVLSGAGLDAQDRMPPNNGPATDLAPFMVDQTVVEPLPATAGEPFFLQSLLMLAAMPAALLARTKAPSAALVRVPGRDRVDAASVSGKLVALRPPLSDTDLAVAAVDVDLLAAGEQPPALRSVSASDLPPPGSDAWHGAAEAAAAALVGPPAFVLRRRLDDSGLPKFLAATLRAPRAAALRTALGPLRRTGAGRDAVNLGWSDQAEDGSEDQPVDPPLLGRSRPFRVESAGVAGVAGSVALPVRRSGSFLPASPPMPSLAWLAERSTVPFADPGLIPTDAAMPDADLALPPRGFLPARGQLGRHLLALPASSYPEGGAERRLQAALPPLVRRAEISERPGTFRTSMVMIARSCVDEGAMLEGARARYGAASSRRVRAPRPGPLPRHAEHPERARRVRGWPGEPELTCLVADGAADLLYAPSEDTGDPVDPWIVVFRLTEPQAGLRAAGPWDGAVGLTLDMLVAGEAPPDESPLAWLGRNVLGNLGEVTAALRLGDDRLTYDLLRISEPTIGAGWSMRDGHARARLIWRLFQTSSRLLEPAPLATGSVDLTLGLPPTGVFVHHLDQTIELTKSTELLPDASTELLPDAAAARLDLPVRIDDRDAPPVAWRLLTVMFEDPAYNRALSGVPAVREVGTSAVELIVDRAAAMAGEELVLAVVAAEGSIATLTISHLSGDRARKPLLCGEMTEASVDIHCNIAVTLALAGCRYQDGPAVLQPGDSITIRAVLADQNAAETKIEIMPTPTLPMPGATYGALRLLAAPPQGVVDCPLYAGNPQAQRIDPLRAFESLCAGALARRGRFRWALVVPVDGENPSPLFIAKTDQSGATCLPDRIADFTSG